MLSCAGPMWWQILTQCSQESLGLSLPVRNPFSINASRLFKSLVRREAHMSPDAPISAWLSVCALFDRVALFPLLWRFSICQCQRWHPYSPNTSSVAACSFMHSIGDAIMSLFDGYPGKRLVGKICLSALLTIMQRHVELRPSCESEPEVVARLGKVPENTFRKGS